MIPLSKPLILILQTLLFLRHTLSLPLLKEHFHSGPVLPLPPEKHNLLNPRSISLLLHRKAPALHLPHTDFPLPTIPVSDECIRIPETHHFHIQYPGLLLHVFGFPGIPMFPFSSQTQDKFRHCYTQAPDFLTHKPDQVLPCFLPLFRKPSFFDTALLTPVSRFLNLLPDQLHTILQSHWLFLHNVLHKQLLFDSPDNLYYTVFHRHKFLPRSAYFSYILQVLSTLRVHKLLHLSALKSPSIRYSVICSAPHNPTWKIYVQNLRFSCHSCL